MTDEELKAIRDTVHYIHLGEYLPSNDNLLKFARLAEAAVNEVKRLRQKIDELDRMTIGYDLVPEWEKDK